MSKSAECSTLNEDSATLSSVRAFFSSLSNKRKQQNRELEEAIEPDRLGPRIIFLAERAGAIQTWWSINASARRACVFALTRTFSVATES